MVFVLAWIIGDGRSLYSMLNLVLLYGRMSTCSIL
jgi:hypothetical protein